MLFVLIYIYEKLASESALHSIQSVCGDPTIIQYWYSAFANHVLSCALAGRDDRTDRMFRGLGVRLALLAGHLQLDQEQRDRDRLHHDHHLRARTRTYEYTALWGRARQAIRSYRIPFRLGETCVYLFL